MKDDMVDKKELRLGNTIRCMNHLPVGFTAPHLVHSDIIEIRETAVETNHGFHKYKNIGPISLTEDILLKSGVKKISDTAYFISKPNEKSIDIYLIRENDLFFLSSDKGGKYSVGIESLHHFQNLYFILTGEEMNIIMDQPT